MCAECTNRIIQRLGMSSGNRVLPSLLRIFGRQRNFVSYGKATQGNCIRRRKSAEVHNRASLNWFRGRYNFPRGQGRDFANYRENYYLRTLIVSFILFTQWHIARKWIYSKRIFFSSVHIGHYIMSCTIIICREFLFV